MQGNRNRFLSWLLPGSLERPASTLVVGKECMRKKEEEDSLPLRERLHTGQPSLWRKRGQNESQREGRGHRDRQDNRWARKEMDCYMDTLMGE